jgi:hypothetical protein
MPTLLACQNALRFVNDGQPFTFAVMIVRSSRSPLRQLRGALDSLL